MEIQELAYQPGQSHAPPPPRISGLPIIGNLVPYLREPNRFFLRCYRERGPVFRVRLGDRTFTVLAGPAAARWVARHEPDALTVAGIYDDIHRLLQSKPEATLICQDGERHAELRRWQKRGMSRSYSEQRLDVSLAVATEELDRVDGQDIVDMADLCKRLIYRQLGTTMAGEAPPELLGDYRTIIDTVINSVRFPWKRYLPVSRRMRRASRRVYAFSRQLAERHAGGVPPGQQALFVHDILAGVERGVCTDDETVSQLLGPFLAGLDTLAHSLAFAVWGLLANPVARLRVQREVDDLFADGLPSAKQIRGAPALRGAAMESLRLYPISPGQLRRARGDFALGGYQIRADDELLLPHAVPHYMEELFPDPDTFDIDRYSAERAEHRPQGAYAPYGLGRHACLGAGVADFLLQVDLACLIRRFDIAPHPANYQLAVRWFASATPHKFRVRLRTRAPRLDVAAPPRQVPSGCPVHAGP